MAELGGFAHAGPKVGELLTTPFEGTSYGLGLMIQEWRGQRRWQHGGGDLGHLSVFHYYPDLDAGVMVFANHHELPPNLVELFLAGQLEPPADQSGLDEGRLAEEAAFEDAMFDRYAGRYVIAASAL